MKREELKKLVEYKLFRMRATSSHLKDLTRKYEKFEEVKIDENDWFPNVEGLESEFEILKSEVKDFLKMEVDSEEYFRNYKCNHQIRMTNYDLRFMGKYEKCVLCERELYNTNCKHSKDDIAMFISKEITGYDEDEICYITHYTDYKILKILLSICEISTEEDIDIVKELNKLKLDHCDIIRNKNKHFILFIIGSNRERIDDYTYYSSENGIYYKDLIKKFIELFNVHITIAGRKEDLKEYEEDKTLELLSYDSIDDLEKIIKIGVSKYDLVIDMSSLFKVKVSGGNVKPERYKINYDKFLPNTKVIRINDLSKDNRSKLIEYLKENSNEFAYNRIINSWFNYYKYDENLKDFDETNPSEENCKLKGYLDNGLFDETRKLLFK